MRISDWSSDVCSSDLAAGLAVVGQVAVQVRVQRARQVRSGVSRLAGVGCRQREPAVEDDQVLALERGGERAGIDKRGPGFGHGCRSSRRSEEHTSELQSLMRI